jgi:uncharacterized repeat protein (TIGR01451 family)
VTAFTAAGQNITYTYDVTNTGQIGVSDLGITDNKIPSGITCAVTTLSAGESTTCTGKYTTTSADVSAGEVTNTATASGDVSEPDLPSSRRLTSVAVRLRCHQHGQSHADGRHCHRH